MSVLNASLKSGEKLCYVGYFDGSCYPNNPNGKMGVGAVIYHLEKHNDNIELWSHSKHYPESNDNTNNVAEYMGLIALLDYFIENDLVKHKIVIRGDSSLVVNQMNGGYKIKKGKYVAKAKEAKEKLKKFYDISINWVPRELNTRADELTKP